MASAWFLNVLNEVEFIAKQDKTRIIFVHLFKAQENVHNERLELIEKYQDCLKKVEKENADKDICDQYLKAAEALK